jgi:hypothetical protein
MARRVFLHIGASKTGTTYLQGRLRANRLQLAAVGMLVPMPLVDHFRFMLDVVDQLDDAPRQRRARGAADRMLARAREWDGDVVISNELFAAAASQQVQHLCQRLAPAEVHVVYTVRDLARTLPAEWQQAVKGGMSTAFADYVSAVRAIYDQPLSAVPTVVGPDDAAAKFAALHRLSDVAARWTAGVPPDRVHVVVLPRSGADPEILWDRFCAALGVEPSVANHRPPRGNASLGAVEAEVLRRINSKLAAHAVHDYQLREWVRRSFVMPVVMARGPGARIALRPDDHGWARAEAAALVTRLASAPYSVIGDLDELVPSPDPGPGVQPESLDPRELETMTCELLAGLLLRWHSKTQPQRTWAGPAGSAGRLHASLAQPR